ncbi:MAG: methionine--tRNA ligase [Deltaproteobacteria bacterium]|nr:methionine--tRNA ligase [Deltaproteobacteria bacterium]
MSSSTEKILVTSALPYANGPIHFGHIAGAYLPADIFVRHKRMCGADIVYICGSDDHGVAITISAMKEGRKPAEHAKHYHDVIEGIFEKFNIEFDNFSATSRPLHYEVSQEFFADCYKAGYIEARANKQFYDEEAGLFLADRYVTGTCPNCGYENARGDECPNCGKWLDPLELKDPKSKITGATPVVRETTHWYLLLDKLQPKLEQWLSTKTHWKDNVVNFVKGWLDQGLEARAITRDMDWGIPIPLVGDITEEQTKGKVLYVWFDAPIGYVSSTKEWALGRGDSDLWKKYWLDPKGTRLIHFIGKDNIPFHCIVFPAVMMAKNEVRDEQFVLPENVPANEFYNLEGKQFSKSEGWYIDLEDFFSKYPVDAIRYTLCANMPQTKDSEFTWNDFMLRNNSELADTFGNFANRVFKFLERHYDNRVPALAGVSDEDQALLDAADALPDTVAALIDKFDFRGAIFEWMEAARKGNVYFDKKAPWKGVKEDVAATGTTFHVCLRLLQSLAVTGYPFMPETAEKLWRMLGRAGDVRSQVWHSSARADLVVGHKMGESQILFEKLDPKQIEAEAAKLKEFAAKSKDAPSESANAADKEYAPLKDEITYEDFAKLDLRTAKIVEAEAVKKSKKLVKLQIDLGFEKRQIVAGIAQHFEPDDLVGRTIVVVANLAPAKLMGIESNGMLLAARDGETLTLLTADSAPGSTVS